MSYQTGLEKRLTQLTHNTLELEQEKYILEEIATVESKNTDSFQKKFYFSIMITAMALSAISMGFFYYESLANKETEQSLTQTIKTKEPLVQNLKGDILDTWIAWAKTPDSTLYVNIINAKDFPRDKVDAVKNAILSKESFDVDDTLTHKGPIGSKSVYYKGWAGALERASTIKTEFFIPTKIQVLEDQQAGDIEIELSKNKDPDGNAGYTKATINDNRILKAKIWLYGLDMLPNDKLATVARHEFGHAMGLAHSTATEDLMAPVITTDYPFITDCTIDAIDALYNGQQKSQVECQK